MEADGRFEEMKIGDELEPVTATVTREMIRDYGELLDDRNPYYSHSEDFDGPIGHPSLAAILIFRLFNERFPPRPGGIHTRQEFCFHRPIRPGITTRIHGKIVDKYEKRGRKYIVIEVSIEDQQGVLLATSKTYSIVP